MIYKLCDDVHIDYANGGKLCQAVKRSCYHITFSVVIIDADWSIGVRHASIHIVKISYRMSLFYITCHNRYHMVSSL